MGNGQSCKQLLCCCCCSASCSFLRHARMLHTFLFFSCVTKVVAQVALLQTCCVAAIATTSSHSFPASASGTCPHTTHNKPSNNILIKNMNIYSRVDRKKKKSRICKCVAGCEPHTRLSLSLVASDNPLLLVFSQLVLLVVAFFLYRLPAICSVSVCGSLSVSCL